MDSSLFACLRVRLLWKAVEQYSVMLLMCKQYKRMMSFFLVPTYFSFDSIFTLEYAFLQISEVFFSQDMSSRSQTPRCRISVCLSTVLLSSFNLVAKLSFFREITIQFDFWVLSFMLFCLVHSAMFSFLVCDWNAVVGRKNWLVPTSDGTRR